MYVGLFNSGNSCNTIIVASYILRNLAQVVRLLIFHGLFVLSLRYMGVQACVCKCVCVQCVGMCITCNLIINFVMV